MIELLVVPDWQAEPRTLDEWVVQLSGLVDRVEVSRESAGVSWLEIGSLRLRGYVVLEGQHVEAINFELNDPDPAPATQVIEAAARALGWEVHQDDDADDESDDED